MNLRNPKLKKQNKKLQSKTLLDNEVHILLGTSLQVQKTMIIKNQNNTLKGIFSQRWETAGKCLINLSHSISVLPKCHFVIVVHAICHP